MTDTKIAPDFIQESDKKNNVNIVNGIDANRLESYIDRIENIEAEKKALQNDIKEIFEEAKSANFDVKAIRQILKIRAKDPDEQAQEDFIVEAYRKALGI